MNELLLRMTGVKKSFGAFQALKGVDFDLHAGQVHALIGKNGAGKSTLMKLLAGVEQPDAGQIILDGRPVVMSTPHVAQQHGVAIVYQEFSLIGALSVAENVFLGRLPRRPKTSIVDWPALTRQTQTILNRLYSTIDPRTRVAALSVAQQQVVEIAKALSIQPRILILDEPTSALSDKETPGLFAMIRKLRDEGVGIVYISHRLAEIEQIADQITILRDGQTVGNGAADTFTRQEIVQLMVGERLANFDAANAPTPQQAVMLSVRHLTRTGVLKDISFDLHKGEILGIAGLVGAGRTELVRAIFGLDRIDSGEIVLNGRVIAHPNPRRMKRLGLAFAPEDRKQQGLIVDMSVRHNIALTILHRLARLGLLSRAEEMKVVQHMVRDLQIAAPNVEVAVKRLSGGNQQKVVLAKWLANAPQVLILDEPTRGIDVGAKAQLFTILENLTRQGVSIIFISSELEEVLAVAHRVLTMYNGRVVAEAVGAHTNLQQVLLNAVGG